MPHSAAIRLQEIHGEALAPWLDALGHLRLRVFREFPYLYDGTLSEERDYLATYLHAPDSLVILATDASGGLVGASTCLPLSQECPEFQEPFLAAEMNLHSICYFGESILLPEFRGQGIGKRFFDLREAHTRRLHLKISAFCAVDRPPDHPLRPADHRPLDPFWISRGYQKQDHLKASFTWKDSDQPAPTAKSLTFWTKSWTP